MIVMFVGGMSIGVLKKRQRANPSDLEELEDIEENEFNMNYREIPFSELMMKKEVGKGSSARVFRGSWRHVPVAIKCMPLDLADESSLREWRKELEIITKLGNHPNILPFLGACTTQPSALYLVTKYCDLGSVHATIFDKKQLLTQEQLQIVLVESCNALDYLHANNIVHRDIAARNFLLCSPFHEYLADFGMARLLAVQSANNAQKTRTDVGPLCWMAPESIYNLEYSKNSDVYMYGMFLYEVVCRRIPFHTIQNLLDVGDSIQAGIRPELTENCPTLLHPVFKSCWVTNADERPTFAQILAIFEHHFCSTEEVSADHPSEFHPLVSTTNNNTSSPTL